MGQLAFNPGHLAWHSFRLPVNISTERDAKGRTIRIIHDHEEACEWMKTNIRGPWSCGGAMSMTSRPFFIRDVSDALLFKLTWCLDTVKPKFGR
jgi:hypothetical protein